LKRASEGAERYDVITIGHVLNELFTGGSDATAQRAAMVEQALSQLKPLGSLVLIEPALRETSRALLGVRDVLVERGYAVRAPCFFRGNCPALVRGSDWCHADRPWQMPRTVEEIARAAGIRKDSVKMSYLVLAPKGEPWKEPPPGRVFRIISEPLEGKGRRRYVGCGPEGRFGLALLRPGARGRGGDHRNRAPRRWASAHRTLGGAADRQGGRAGERAKRSG
jgi:ribosomal protein RSM22 (predicted rRNA methylase)